MSEGGYQIRNQNAVHFITFSVIEWIDVFTRKMYADIIVDSLMFCQKNKGLNIHAWCLMSNHIHLIVSRNEPFTLSDFLRDFKNHTSSKIVKAIEENKSESRRNWMLWIFKKAGENNKRNETYQFWQQDNHPIECLTDEILQSKLKYIHENPVRAGIVRNEGEYVYSSGIDYYTEEKGLVDINFLN